MRKGSVFVKTFLLLFLLPLVCSLILFAIWKPANQKIKKNQTAEIEKTIEALFPSGKDLKREEEKPSFSGVTKQYRFTDSKGQVAAYGAVLTIKDQHTNTFLVLAKKDGSLIGLRPLLSYGAHAFPEGDYNEAFLDSFQGQTAPIYLEDYIEGEHHDHVLTPLSRDLNALLLHFAEKGEITE